MINKEGKNRHRVLTIEIHHQRLDDREDRSQTRSSRLRSVNVPSTTVTFSTEWSLDRLRKLGSTLAKPARAGLSILRSRSIHVWSRRLFLNLIIVSSHPRIFEWLIVLTLIKKNFFFSFSILNKKQAEEEFIWFGIGSIKFPFSFLLLLNYLFDRWCKRGTFDIRLQHRRNIHRSLSPGTRNSSLANCRSPNTWTIYYYNTKLI